MCYLRFCGTQLSRILSGLQCESQPRLKRLPGSYGTWQNSVLCFVVLSLGSFSLYSSFFKASKRVSPARLTWLLCGIITNILSPFILLIRSEATGPSALHGRELQGREYWQAGVVGPLSSLPESHQFYSYLLGIWIKVVLLLSYWRMVLDLRPNHSGTLVECWVVAVRK